MSDENHQNENEGKDNGEVNQWCTEKFRRQIIEHGYGCITLWRPGDWLRDKVGEWVAGLCHEVPERTENEPGIQYSKEETQQRIGEALTMCLGCQPRDVNGLVTKENKQTQDVLSLSRRACCCLPAEC